MAGETARGLHALQWTNTIDLRVRQVSGEGSIHNNMTDLIEPPLGGRIQILVSGSFLVYRILDEDSVELERHAIPEWLAVDANLVVP